MYFDFILKITLFYEEKCSKYIFLIYYGIGMELTS
jgi:hypothetical protein